jgi:hypothetical protein
MNLPWERGLDGGPLRTAMKRAEARRLEGKALARINIECLLPSAEGRRWPKAG